MIYSEKQLNRILSLEKSCDLFSILSFTDSGNKASWRDIFAGLKYFIDSPQGEYLDFKLELTIEGLVKLENDYGFDINFIDINGNNLLLYAQSVVALPYTDTIFQDRKDDCFKNNLGQSNIFHFEDCIDYIIINTKNVYLVNNDNEQLPFMLISHCSAGDEAKTLINRLAEYKDFDLDMVNKYGYNLMTSSIYLFSPPEVIEFLSKLQIDKTQISHKNESILHFIDNCNPAPIYHKIFQEVFSSLDNPFFKNNEGYSFLEVLIKKLNSPIEHKNNKLKPLIWLKLALKEIASDNYKFNKDTIDSLTDFFENKDSSIYNYFKSNPGKDEIVKFNEAKISFRKRLLNEDLELNSPIVKISNIGKI